MSPTAKIESRERDVRAVRFIVGTAGHIDHGKSALVHALTGIETDRLPEEKARGISIELGFAHLDIDGLGRAGVVDVPGHERFLRQMLAGAHGFDLVLVVVAADDGVMPQTEEHFDIVHLLGVRRAIFVIAKTDLASPGRVDEVRGEIEILAAGTPFESSPVVAVSARTGDGIAGLREAIGASLEALAPRSGEGAFRIPVDRAFLVKGHGVVVTGTALAGTVSVGDEVVILPERNVERSGIPHARSARVRELQVHGLPVSRATAGERIALNLAGIDLEDVRRGDTVTVPGAVAATTRLDARIEVRPASGRALASHVRVRVHHGTREALARLVWLDGVAEVAPRRNAFAQLILEDPLVALPGDRFVLRDETASRTLGGGIVLSAHAARHRPSHGDVAPSLRGLEDEDAATRVVSALALERRFGLELGATAAAANVDSQALRAIAAKDERIEILGDEDTALVVLREKVSRTEASITDAVTAWQSANANLAGVDVEHLRGSVKPAIEAKTFRLLLDRLAAAKVLVRSGNVVRTRGHEASLGAADEALAGRALARIVSAGSMPPAVKDLAAELGADALRVSKVAAVLVLRGDLVKIAADLYFARAAIDGIGAKLTAYLREKGEITPAAFRDLIAASRKYGIPLLDWFDREGLTIRVGDLRRLRRP